MDEPLKPPKEPEMPTLGQIVTGFVLTLFALPFLFVATCLPALVVAQVSGLIIAFALWGIGLVAFGIWRARETENPGVRWAIIIIIATAAVAGALMAWPEAVNLVAKH